MSLPRETTVKCEKCQAEQVFTLWETLNVTLNRDEKEKLLKGELTLFACRKCGWSGQITYPLLYHDMEKHLMIWLSPEPGEPDLQGMPFAGSKGYQFRLVASRNELVEKILIFDDGLDDRVVEFFKLLLWAQASKTQHPLNGTMFFNGLETGINREVLIRFDHLREGGSDSFTVTIESYRLLLESLGLQLSNLEKKKGEWLRVTRDFAISMAPMP